MSSDKQPQYCFKSTTFEHTSKVGNKKKVWKSLKQILASEKALKWPEDTVLYSSINALPSFKPAKKYSDISGLIVSIVY
ncbi:INO80 complex subunit C-like [Ctenocephalides felis]|uniref:INO80 complex subunit C-like n=1 Tax=Ctenocephalides felis TaxID=7515 RepID=UPI000E6E358E|nr:INO80 complex subunit C-like [Ctenocephalides felis]